MQISNNECNKTLKRFPADMEYTKDKQLIKQSVVEVLQWVESQPHLPNISEEDAILFLASCYHDIEHAKTTIEKYYTFRTNTPEFFKNRDPLLQMSILSMDVAAFIPMPGLTAEGYKVIYIALMESDPSKLHFVESTKCLFFNQDIVLFEEGASKGFCFVINLEGCGLRHLARVSPFAVRKMLYYLQNAMPARLRSVNFIYPVFFMDTILSLIKPFLNRAMADIIFIHNSLDELYEFVPKRIMPREIGGDLPNSVREMQFANNEKVRSHRGWLLEEEKMRVDEALRQKDISDRGWFGWRGWL